MKEYMSELYEWSYASNMQINKHCQSFKLAAHICCSWWKLNGFNFHQLQQMYALQQVWTIVSCGLDANDDVDDNDDGDAVVSAAADHRESATSRERVERRPTRQLLYRQLQLHIAAVDPVHFSPMISYHRAGTALCVIMFCDRRLSAYIYKHYVKTSEWIVTL